MPIGRVGAGEAAEAVALYEIRKKIYPRAVHGWFARWRWALVFATQVVFYGLPWLAWNGRQAVLFDLAARKFYIFGLVFWPQDVIYLTVLLILAALVAVPVHRGRRAPVVRLRLPADGLHRDLPVDRAQDRRRPRWRASGSTARRCRARKVAQEGRQARRVDRARAVDRLHLRRLLHADPRRSACARSRWQLGPWETFWILFYGFATYGNAGWMREQVCKYMCPYARFQA